MSSLGSAEFGKIKTDSRTGVQYIQTKKPRGSSWRLYSNPVQSTPNKQQNSTAEIKKTFSVDNKALGKFSSNFGNNSKTNSPFTAAFGTDLAVGGELLNFKSVQNSNLLIIEGDRSAEFKSGQVDLYLTGKGKGTPQPYFVNKIYTGGTQSGSTSGVTTGSTTGSTSAVTIVNFHGNHKFNLGSLENLGFVSNYTIYFTGVTSGSTTGTTTGFTSGSTSGITSGITSGSTSTGTTTGSTSTGTTGGGFTGTTSGFTAFTSTVVLSTPFYVRNLASEFITILNYTGITSGTTTGTTSGITSGITTGSTTGTTTGSTSGNTTGTTTGYTIGVLNGISAGYTTFDSTANYNFDYFIRDVKYEFKSVMNYSGLTGTTGVTSGITTGITSGITTGSTTGITSGLTITNTLVFNDYLNVDYFNYSINDVLTFTGTTGSTTGITSATTITTTNGYSSYVDLSNKIEFPGLNLKDIYYSTFNYINFTGTTGSTTGVTTGTTTGTTTGATYSLSNYFTDPIFVLNENIVSYSGQTSGTTSGSTSGITSAMTLYTVVELDSDKYTEVSFNQTSESSNVIINETKDFSFVSGNILDNNVASSSYVFGYNNIAKGINTFVINSNNAAYGISSFAHGNLTISDGNFSESGGVGAIAKHTGELSRSSTYFDVPGDSQYQIFTMALETKAADESIPDDSYEMYINNLDEKIKIEEDGFYQFSIDCVCLIIKDNNSNDTGAFFTWSVKDNLISNYRGVMSLVVNPSLPDALQIPATNKSLTPIGPEPNISFGIENNNFYLKGYSNNGFNYKYYAKIEMIKLSHKF